MISKGLIYLQAAASLRLLAESRLFYCIVPIIKCVTHIQRQVSLSAECVRVGFEHNATRTAAPTC